MRARRATKTAPALAIATAALAVLPPAATAGTAEMRASRAEAGNQTQTLVYVARATEANRVTVRYDQAATGYELVDSTGVIPGNGCVRPAGADATRVRCSAPSPTPLDSRGPLLLLGDGDDTVSVTATTARLNGGEGNDELRGALTVGSTFTGGPGDDHMVGGSGRDVFHEERSANGADRMNGSIGRTDEVTYSGRRRGVRADLQGDRDDGERGERDLIEGVERLRGGRGSDVLRGNDADNVIVGGRGSDVLSGRGGDDQLGADVSRVRTSSRRTRDRINGGEGQDRIFGSGGANSINGGAGADVVKGGRGGDRIRTRDSSIDELSCDGGRDTVVLDAFDYFADACERVRRNLPAGATIVQLTTRGRASALVEIGCPGDARGGCTGSVALHERGSRLGRGSFDTRRASRESVRIRLPRRVVNRLGEQGGLRVTLVLRTTTATGSRRRITLALRLGPPTFQRPDR
jgi:hypothetical protein